MAALRASPGGLIRLCDSMVAVTLLSMLMIYISIMGTLTGILAGALVPLTAFILFALRLWDRRKRVRISTKTVLESDSKTSNKRIYQCEVTNIGKVALTVEMVTLEPPEGGNAGIVLELPKGEQQRALNQGDMQPWIKVIGTQELWKPNAPGAPTPVTAVVRDTGGKEHRSKQTDTVPYPS